MIINKIKGDLKGWVWNQQNNCLANPLLGRIQVVSVCDEKGVEVYQQPVWLETKGEINIIVNDKQKIGFIKTTRHVVIPPAKYAKKWSDWKAESENDNLLIPHPVDLKPGIDELELPRGFSNVSLQKAEEEIRYKVKLVSSLGHLNANTTFFATSPFVLACKALPIPSDISPDPREVIKKVIWLSPEETQKIDTLCGFTYASLFLFRRWALKQKEHFWKNIGERM